MPGKKERAVVFAPRPGKPAGQAKAELPSVPSAGVSTEGGACGPTSLRDSPAGESTAPRVFAPPLSRLLRPMPSGREVTIEVASDDRTGLEDRIAVLALRLGGTVRREETGAAGGVGAEETFPLREIVRVHVPVDTADAFLEELGEFGGIPPGSREKQNGRTHHRAPLLPPPRPLPLLSPPGGCWGPPPGRLPRPLFWRNGGNWGPSPQSLEKG